jgi:hypothetical protein
MSFYKGYLVLISIKGNILLSRNNKLENIGVNKQLVAEE